MKIIKQNDSAGGLIFKQNTDGKAMKQNYNFGKGLKIFSTAQLPEITLDLSLKKTDAYTIMVFNKVTERSGVLGTYYPIIDGAKNGTTGTYFHRGLNRSGNGLNTVYHFNGVKSDAAYGLQLCCFGTNGVDKSKYLNIATGGVRTVNVLPDFDITSYFFAFSSSSIVIKGTRNGFAIFDRLLEDDEIIYRRNNCLGNDFLTYNGLIHYYPMAEGAIRQISGIDTVVLEDVVGGNHIPIRNLPAGSLIDKLLYFNSNFFEYVI